MKKLIKSVGFSGALYLLLSSYVPVSAADTLDVDLKPTDSQFSVLGDLTLGQIISAAIILVLIIAAIVFFFMLVIGGVRWIMSGGDKAATEAARSQITAALIGLVIVFAAWAIAQIINVFFGIDIFNLQFSGVS
jgi:hypothetical protein